MHNQIQYTQLSLKNQVAQKHVALEFISIIVI